MGRQSLKTRADARASTPSQIVAARRDAISKMPSKLATLFTRIAGTMSDQREQNLRFYHRLGQEVRKIRDKPDDYAGTDGTPGVRLLEQALGTQARTLRKAALFNELYDPTQLNQLVGLYNKDSDFQLHWGHVSYLLSVKDADKRWEVSQEAVKQMLDPPALHALIKKRAGRGGGHGRPHKVPQTLPAQLRQLVNTTQAWNNKQEQVWDGEKVNVFSNLLEAGPDDITSDMLELIDAAIEAQQNMIDEGTKNIAKLQRTRERYVGGLKKKKEAEEKAAREAAAGEPRRAQRSINLDNNGTGSHKGARRSRAPAQAL